MGQGEQRHRQSTRVRTQEDSNGGLNTDYTLVAYLPPSYQTHYDRR